MLPHVHVQYRDMKKEDAARPTVTLSRYIIMSNLIQFKEQYQYEETIPNVMSINYGNCTSQNSANNGFRLEKLYARYKRQ